MSAHVSRVVYIPKQSDDEALLTSDRAALQSPWRLLWIDCWILFKNLRYVPNALFPLRKLTPLAGVPYSSWWESSRDYFLITIISLIELFLLPTTAFIYFVCSGWFSLLYTALVVFFIYLCQRVMWGPLVLTSRTTLDNLNAFPHERWLFINGVAASQRGLQLTLDRLSSTFRRPITGVHNRSWGIPFDIIECILQRCFAYSTTDVRTCYEYLKIRLLNDETMKVVVIAHSQGGIILALALDRLFLELSSREIRKLEIYTFGSAAAHFNDPRLSVQELRREGSLHSDEESLTISLSDSRSTTAPLSRVTTGPLHAPPTPISSEAENDHDNEMTVSTQTQKPMHNGLQRRRTHHLHLVRAPSIRTIEHYTNEFDLVPRWGVLYATCELPHQRYAGRVFINQGASGHLFDQHYLEEMFPVDEEGRLKEGGFLDEGVVLDRRGSWREKEVRDGDGERRPLLGKGANGEGEGRQRLIEDGGWRWLVDEGVEGGVGDGSDGEGRPRGRTVRELSVLWRYVGGGEG